MYVNSRGEGFKNLSYVPMTSHLSLGNLGYASVQCEITPMIATKVFLKCPYANITRIVDNGDGFGISITPKHVVDTSGNIPPGPRLCGAHKPEPVPEWDRNRCLRSAKSYHQVSNIESVDKSPDYLISDSEMEALMKKTCYGKNSCSLTLEQLIKKEKMADVTQDSTVFIQYTCEETPENVEDTHSKLWMLSTLQVLTLIVFVFAINILKEQTKQYKKEFQLKQTSVGNYTAKIMMSRAIIDNFKEHLATEHEGQYEFGEDEHPAQKFKEYLTEKIESTLS